MLVKDVYPAKDGVIYGIFVSHLQEFIYVGRSKNLEQRKSKHHRGLHDKNNQKIHQYIQEKFQWNQIEFRILDTYDSKTTTTLQQSKLEHIYYTILKTDFDLMNDVKPYDDQHGGVKECYMCNEEYSASNISKHYKICEKKMSDKMKLVKRVQQLEADLHESSKMILQKDIQNQKLQAEMITVVRTKAIETDHLRNQIMQLTLICNTLKVSSRVR